MYYSLWLLFGVSGIYLYCRGQSDRHLFGVFIIVDGGFVLISFDGNLCYFEAFMVVLNVKFMFSSILNVPFHNNCLNYFYISRSFVWNMLHSFRFSNKDIFHLA